MSSIRSLVIKWTLLVLLISNVLTSVLVYLHSQKQLADLLDAEQAQLARTIAVIISRHTHLHNGEDVFAQERLSPSDQILELSSQHNKEASIAFQVWDNLGNLRIMSRNAPLYPLSANNQGFTSVQYQDIDWRIFTLYMPRLDMWVHTAQRSDIRQQLIVQIVMDNLWPMWLASMLTVLVLMGIISLGLKPLRRLSKALAEVKPLQFQSLPDSHIKELQPIENAVNSLVEQVHKNVAQEKAFSADAAHELRTPLAAMRVHAHNLKHDIKLSAQAEESHHLLLSSIDRMSNTIEQLLQLNRLEQQGNYDLFELVNLAELLGQVIAELPVNVLQNYDVSLQAEPVVVQSNRQLLFTVMRNLLENAHKYSQVGSAIELGAVMQEGAVEIYVLDQGQGMTEQQKAQATTRFYRANTCVQQGSGLGLAIVQRATEIIQAKLIFSDNVNGKGLKASVVLSLR
ncbi:Signal transduction histidine kinase [Catenovulum agarivorans DS-2]|uniref:histidine kinase n=1 Tax=Catenovulum agarivorans DS-2 TaxID=1328313 RepID=W7QS19_9ALTE|nr:ATP-binding protein [Catenovulum agarivorans]EWH10643.1 Signal transduction histidine kinase [Catenovulum agarivorans DS-2]